MLLRLLHHGAVARGTRPEGLCLALTLEDRQCNIVARAERAEQLADLIGAGETAIDAATLRQSGELGAADVNAAGARRDAAGERVHQRGLARTVRPDQRMPRTGRDLQVNAVYGGEMAEPDGELAGFERGDHFVT